MLHRTTGSVLRRFHLGARHAADVLGVAATEVTEQIKQSIHMSDASVSSESIEFRLVRPLVKGIEVKTPYGIGTILRLKGFEGVAGFSLVVQLDSWVLAGGQKPMLYCDADEVIAVNESYGQLSEESRRRTTGEKQSILIDSKSFIGDDSTANGAEGQELSKDGSRSIDLPYEVSNNEVIPKAMSGGDRIAEKTKISSEVVTSIML